MAGQSLLIVAAVEDREKERGRVDARTLAVDRRAMMNEDESVSLQFHGAGRTVTGSCMELVCGERRLLIDCGLF